MFYNYDVSPFWRFAPQLSVIEATLLILGIEPQGASDRVEDQANRPEGYEAVKASLLAALRSKELHGQTACYKNEWFCGDTMTSHEYEDVTVCDPHKTFISVDDLKRWLTSKGHNEGYFFAKQADAALYLDPTNERYAPKLAAAVRVWMAFDPEQDFPGTPKQRMQKWLRLHATEFGLTSEDGSPAERSIEEIARIANWATSGGAPKSIQKQETKALGIELKPSRAIDFSQDFDDEIPF